MKTEKVTTIQFLFTTKIQSNEKRIVKNGDDIKLQGKASVTAFLEDEANADILQDFDQLINSKISSNVR